MIHRAVTPRLRHGTQAHQQGVCGAAQGRVRAGQRPASPRTHLLQIGAARRCTACAGGRCCPPAHDSCSFWARAGEARPCGRRREASVARAEVESMCPKSCARWPAPVTRMIAVSRSASSRVVAQRAPTHRDSACFAERVGWWTAVRMLRMRAEGIGANSSCGAFRSPPGRRPRWNAGVEGFCCVFEFELAEEVFSYGKSASRPCGLDGAEHAHDGRAPAVHSTCVPPGDWLTCAGVVRREHRVGVCVANTALRRIRWLILYGACSFVQTTRN
jgi:hypothetical protein